MKTHLFPHSLLAGGVVFLGAALFTTYESLRLVANKRELATARREVAATRLKVPRPAATAKVARIRALPSGRSAPGTSDAFVERLESLKKKAIGRAPGGVPLIFPEDLFDYHPPLKATYLDAVKGRQWVEYGPFYANAGLNPAEIAQFEAIAMDHELAILEVRKTAEARGVDPADPAIQQIKTTADQMRKDRLLALLGDERFRQLENHTREGHARNMLLGLSNLVATTFYTDEPVTVTQMNQLATLTTEIGMFSASKANRNPDAFNQLTIKSATILTPRQLEVFDLMLDYQQYALARWQMYNPEEAKRR